MRPREDLGGARPSVRAAAVPVRCPKCGCDDPSMLEVSAGGQTMPLQVAERASAYAQESDSGSGRGGWSLFCNVCSHQWREGADGRRFRSLDDLIKSTGLRRDEVTVLAEVGALNSLGYDRRSALWQVERAVRPAGELFEEQGTGSREQGGAHAFVRSLSSISQAWSNV